MKKLILGAVSFSVLVIALATPGLGVVSPPAVEDDFCDAQIEYLPEGEPCEGCTFTFNATAQDSADCATPCIVQYSFTISCPGSSSFEGGTYEIPCGLGAVKTYSCGEEEPFAGARMFCAPCD